MNEVMAIALLIFIINVQCATYKGNYALSFDGLDDLVTYVLLLIIIITDLSSLFLSPFNNIEFNHHIKMKDLMIFGHLKHGSSQLIPNNIGN